MERSEHPRVVVIGAGIVGSAIAMHLAEPDLVVAACRSATTAAGGRLLLGEPAQVRLDDHGIRVEVGERVLRPEIAVLAAGAESVAIVRTVGLDIPTLASPGLLVET